MSGVCDIVEHLPMLATLILGILSGSLPLGDLEYQMKALRVHVSDRVASHLVIRRVKPVCPIACSLCDHAEVKLKLVISKSGTVRHVTVVRADSRLADAAAEAARLWRFKPYMLQGSPVEYETYASLRSWTCRRGPNR